MVGRGVDVAGMYVENVLSVFCQRFGESFLSAVRACHLVGARGLNARSLHSIANRLLPSQAVADRGQLIAGMASQLLPVGKMMSRERLASHSVVSF